MTRRDLRSGFSPLKTGTEIYSSGQDAPAGTKFLPPVARRGRLLSTAYARNSDTVGRRSEFGARAWAARLFS